MKSEQLSMFDPVGQELAHLAMTHADTAAKLSKQAETLKLCGFSASARQFTTLAELSQSQADTCEIALMFEQLAGL